MTQFLFRYYAVKGFTYLVIIGRVCICSLKSYWKQALRSKTHFISIKTYKIKKIFISLFFYLNFRSSGWDLLIIYSLLVRQKNAQFFARTYPAEFAMRAVWILALLLRTGNMAVIWRGKQMFNTSRNLTFYKLESDQCIWFFLQNFRMFQILPVGSRALGSSTHAPFTHHFNRNKWYK